LESTSGLSGRKQAPLFGVEASFIHFSIRGNHRLWALMIWCFVVSTVCSEASLQVGGTQVLFTFELGAGIGVVLLLLASFGYF